MTQNEMSERAEAARRKSRLEWYENEIQKRGTALASIFLELRRDRDQPYLLNHDSFESYCAERWNMTPRRIRQIEDGEAVRAILMDSVPESACRIAPMKERALREIVQTPPEKRAEVLREAVKTPGRVTAAKLKMAKARVIEPAAPALVTSPEPSTMPDAPADVARMQAAVCRVINALAHHLPDCWREYLLAECDLKQPVDGPHPQARPKQRNPVPTAP